MAKVQFSASSFVTEVLNSAGPMEKDDINNKISRLSQKVDEVKFEVYESLQKKYEEFYPDLKSAIQLNDRVQALTTEMDAMAGKIDKEIKTKLQASTSEFQDLSEQLKEANIRHAILEKLVCIHENLEGINQDLLKNDFVSAADRLVVIEERLQEPANEREKEITILSVLESQYSLQQEKLKQDINVAWARHIHWEVPDEKLEGSVETKTVTLQIERTEHSSKVLGNIVQALLNFDMLDSKMKAFAERLYKYILQVAISEPIVLEEKRGNEMFELVATYPKKKTAEPVAPKVVFERLMKVMAFLNEGMFNMEVKTTSEEDGKAPLMALLGDALAETLQEEIRNQCLSPAVPSNQGDLESFTEVIADTETFHADLVKVKFIHENNKVLIDFVNNINVLFANKKCQEILETARTLMTSELHNTVQVTENHPFGELPSLDLGSAKKAKATESLVLPANMKLSANIFKLPTFCISAHAQALVELAYTTLAEAVQSNTACAIQLFYAVRNVFELYCSVVPTYHKENLETLPQLSALEHNNCMYIAHHLLTLGHQYKTKLPPPLSQGAATFIDLVPVLRRMGTDCFLKQLTLQRDQLLDILKQADGFQNVSEGENMFTVERALKQVLFQLERLEKIWKPVLPENIYAKSIGTLINSVIVEIMTCITSLEDISADDASQLSTILNSVVTKRAPALFTSESDESNQPSGATTDARPMLIHQQVRKWAKFQEMLLVLNANLQGIGDRWADGKGPLAAECSAVEVKQLIRALFQNTDRRAALLAKIK